MFKAKVIHLIGALRPKIPLIVLISIYVVILSAFSVERYNCYLTGGFDLGVFNQAFWTTLHGKLFYETPDLPLTPSGSFLGVHFAPLLFLLLPIYALHPSPITLLVLQTVFIGLGAIPIYLISDEVLKSRGKSLAFASLYLSYPTIHSLNIYDFHIQAFLPFFLLSSYYCYLKRRWTPYWIFIVFSLITIDFAPVLIAVMSLANILSNKDETLKVIHGKLRKLEKHTVIAILSLLVSIASFLLILQTGILLSGKTNTVEGILSSFLASNWIEAFSRGYNCFLQFWLFQISNLLFFPLFEPILLLMIVPWFLVTILNCDAMVHFALGYQHGRAFVAPFLFIASIYGTKRLLHKNRGDWRLAFAVMFLLSALISPLNPVTENNMLGIAYEGYPRRTSHTAVLDQVLLLIPENASVYTVNNLFPQLSNRDNIYLYLPDEVDIDYVLADTKSRWYNYKIRMYPPNFRSNMAENLPNLMYSEDYGIVAFKDGVILLKRGYRGEILIFEETISVYNHENLTLRYGSRTHDPTSTSGTVLVHQPSDPLGCFWFGPYVNLLPGNYTATFRLKVENITTGHLLTLRVTRKLGTVVLASLEVKGSDFERKMSWQNFTLSFNISQDVARGLTGAEENLEFIGIAASSETILYLDYIEVRSVEGSRN